MKKIALILVAILLLSLTATFASADIIIPPEDDFYEEHADECSLHERNYYAKWDLAIVESPENNKVLKTVSPGTIVRADYIYTDANGEVWGLSMNQNEGWFMLSLTDLVYDHISFMEENSNLITIYEGESPTFANDEALFYTYPNSGTSFKAVVTSDASFSYTYTDEDGYQWLYTPYFRLQEGWVCVEDPMNEGLNSMDKEFVPPTEPAPEVLYTEQNTTWIWIVCIVGAVVVVTVVLLAVFFGKKKKEIKE